MRLDSRSLTTFNTLDMAVTPRRMCTSEAVRDPQVRCLPHIVRSRPQDPIQRRFLLVPGG